jgi:hypothetical protein
VLAEDHYWGVLEGAAWAEDIGEEEKEGAGDGKDAF